MQQQHHKAMDLNLSAFECVIYHLSLLDGVRVHMFRLDIKNTAKKSGSDALVGEEGSDAGASPWTSFRISCLEPQAAPKAQGKAKTKAKAANKRKKDKQDKENVNVEGSDGTSKRACNWINLNPNVVEVDKSKAPLRQNPQSEDTQMVPLESLPDSGPESISTADQKWQYDMKDEVRTLLELRLPKADDTTTKVKDITDAKQKGITEKLQLVSRMHSAIVVSLHCISTQGVKVFWQKTLSLISLTYLI